MNASFFRIPPFPGHRATPLATGGGMESATTPEALAQAVCAAQVGGEFWAARAQLPAGRNVVLAPDSAAQLVKILAGLTRRQIERAVVLGGKDLTSPALLPRIDGPVDPWSVAEAAGEIHVGAGQELALIAALCGTTTLIYGEGRFAAAESPAQRLAQVIAADGPYRDPFSGNLLDPLAVVALLGEWRHLIVANRPVRAVLGAARWKRITLDPLLWDGTRPVPHRRSGSVKDAEDGYVVAWKSRADPDEITRLETCGTPLAELEDGMIRSTGLGANCVPPLSVIVDRRGVYFDPAQSSDLEHLLEHGRFEPAMLARAAALRHTLVAHAISKYGQGGQTMARPTGGQRRVLVTGQVEDDRSIISGGGNCSNLDVLARARALEPDAWIIYKPHPDVEAGHRKGYVPVPQALRHADEVLSDAPITALIDSVDAVHVITSLSGFEALLRGKEVTTHGVPFYAGWGLTRDKGPIPARRTRSLSLDELVAATLLIYPRYVDPATLLPCGAEVVVKRMAEGQATVHSPLITLRQWQGQLKRQWQQIMGQRQ